MDLEMAHEEVPTQLLRLNSEDFGARAQDPPGGRIGRIGLPPPTEMVPVELLLRDEREVMAEVRAERGTLRHRARTTFATWVAYGGLAMVALEELIVGLRSRGATERMRTVTEATVLRVKASADGCVAARVQAGDRLLVYPDLTARPGWILSRTASGEIGFIRLQQLS